MFDEIKHFIVKGVSEKDIAAECVKLLREKGITQCWYHGVSALVLCGSRSKMSVSGKDYIECDSKEEARYIKVFLDADMQDICIPKNKEYLKQITLIALSHQ